MTYQRVCKKGSKGLVGIEKDRYRAFIHQFHRHHGLENAGGDADPKLAQRFAKSLVNRLGLLRWSGRDETGAAAAARVAIQRELRNDESRTLHVEKRAIHLLVLVLKNAKVGG